MSSGSIRIIQLPEKSSVNTDDYMAVDSSANGTKKVKFTDLLDNNLSAQNKAADAQATGEAINDINARVDNMINTQTNAEITTLWTGTLENKNQSVTLSQSIANFDFIDIYGGDVDEFYIRKPVANTISFEIQTQNMSDDASVQFLRWWETTLRVSGTTATITKCIRCYWDNFSQHPVVSQATAGVNVTRIDGVKIGHVENDEIVDARVGENGITYPTLGDAIKGQVTDLKSDLTNANKVVLDVNNRAVLSAVKKSASLSPCNVFDKLSAKDGYRLNSSGQPYADADYTIGNFIPVNANDVIKTSHSNRYISFYDSSYTHLSQSVGAFSATAPSDTAYMRISTATSLKNSFMAFINASVPSTYYEYGDGENVSLDYDEAFFNMLNLKESTSLPIEATLNAGWYIDDLNSNAGTVKLVSGNSNFKVSVVPVESNVTYKIQGETKLQGAYPLVAFSTTNVMSASSQGILVIRGSNTDTTYNEEYTPSQDGYLWVASYSTRTILSVAKKLLYPDGTPHKQTLKVQLFGDSITDNTWGDNETWANYVDDYMPVYDITLVNSAVGGSRLSKSSSSTDAVENLIEDDIVVENDADMFVIWAGTNDWASGAPELGTFLGTTSFYGAVNNIITDLSTNHPETMVLFITPMQRYNATDQERETDEYGTPLNSRGYTLKQFCDAITQTCEYYGIPCLDMNSELGINRINVATFTDDGLHPNTKGDKRIAHLVCKKINSLMGISY